MKRKQRLALVANRLQSPSACFYNNYNGVDDSPGTSSNESFWPLATAANREKEDTGEGFLVVFCKIYALEMRVFNGFWLMKTWKKCREMLE